MVDGWTGKWYPEEDYSKYPKEKWCDYDKLCNAIRNDGYDPKTDMENLITMCFLHFDNCLEFENDCAKDYLKMYDDYGDACVEFIKEDGGWEEFDYYC